MPLYLLSTVAMFYGSQKIEDAIQAVVRDRDQAPKRRTVYQYSSNHTGSTASTNVRVAKRQNGKTSRLHIIAAIVENAKRNLAFSQERLIILLIWQ